MKRFMIVWGAALLFFLIFANVSGFILFPTGQARPEPRSMRDNPGAYRYHFFGGK